MQRLGRHQAMAYIEPMTTATPNAAAQKWTTRYGSGSVRWPVDEKEMPVIVLVGKAGIVLGLVQLVINVIFEFAILDHS